MRIGLLASRSHRYGPDSRLIRFVREFEGFLVNQELWAIKGTALAIQRAGLLKTGFIRQLPSGREGGIVHITQKVVDGELDVVIYLMDPRDPTSIYPESSALKRECVAKGKLFLSTYMSAVEWASLIWNPNDGRMLNSEEWKGIDPRAQAIALIAHDELKVQMLKFALLDHIELLKKFNMIITTGTTGAYLSDPIKRRKLQKEWKTKLTKIQAEGNKEEVQRIKDELSSIERILREKPQLTVNPKLSGPKGGDVQIAHEVLQGGIQKVIFFEDPYAARPHEPDIQLLERTCRVRGDHVVCFSDPTSADVWASAWKRADKYVERVPVTVLRALEREYGEERPLRVVLVPTNQRDPDLTMNNICEAAAWYVYSFIERLWLKRLAVAELVKIVVPWGSTMGEFAEKLGEVKAKVRSLSEEWSEIPFQPEVEVMAMTGLLGTEQPSVEANVLAERVSKIFKEKGRHYSIPGAMFVKKDAFSSAHVEDAVSRLSNADIVLLMGAPTRDPFGIEAKAPVWPAIVEHARDKGAVGEVCGLFVDKNGNEIELTNHQRIGLGMAQLRHIANGRNRRAILIIGSRLDYLPLAKALLKANVVSTLITDLRFGRWLLGVDIPSEETGNQIIPTPRRKGLKRDLRSSHTQKDRR